MDAFKSLLMSMPSGSFSPQASAASEKGSMLAPQKPDGGEAQASKEAAYGARASSSPGQWNSQALEERLNAASRVGAANAVAAAVAAGPAAQAQPVANRQWGTPLPRELDVVYDPDAKPAGAPQPQLEVVPITMYNNEHVEELRRQIAVNRCYICYSLKQGQIRVINRLHAGRALLKGHSRTITDLRFFSDTENVLASAGKDGRVCVWRLAEADGIIRDQCIMAFATTPQADLQQAVRLAWHPHMQDCLAVAAGRTVIARITCFGPGLDESEDLQDSADSAREPILLSVSEEGDTPGTAVNFSPNADLLAIGNEVGMVSIWDVEAVHRDQGAHAARKWHIEAFKGQAVGAVEWVGSAGAYERNPVLLVGDANNAVLTLWTCGTETPRRLQTLRILGSPFNQLHVVLAAELVLLGDTRHRRLIAVHIAVGSGDLGPAMLDHVVEFSVAVPILSMTAERDSEPGGKLALFCVQTTAIQQYTLDAPACRPRGPAPPEAIAALPADTPANGAAAPQIPTPVAPPADNNSEDPLSTASAATHKVAGSDEVSPIKELQPADATAASSALELESLLFDDASTEPQFSGASLDARLPEPQLSSASHGAAPVPSTTPAKRAGDMAGSQSASPAKRPVPEPTPAALPLPAHPRWPEASPPPRPDASPFAGILPPVSTPSAAASQQPRLLTPTQLMLAAKAAASRSPSATSSLLSETLPPERIEPAVERRDVPSGEACPAPTGLGVRFREPPASPQPPTTILQRPKATDRSPPTPPPQPAHHPIAPQPAPPLQPASTPLLDAPPAAAAPSNTMQAATPAAAALEEHAAAVASEPPASSVAKRNPGSVALGEEKVDVTLSVVQPTAGAVRGRDATPPPQASDRPGTSGSSTPTAPSSAAAGGAGAEALLARVEALQRKLEKQLASSQAAIAKGVQQELKKETRRLESAMEAQVARLFKAQARAVADERAALLAEQYKATERLITAISASVNRDLPARLEGMLRREAGGVAAALPDALSPALAAGLADALPTHLGAPALQGVLESALKECLGSALASPLQDAFAAGFQQRIVPAFEAACQSMFSQVQATFAGGLAEHLQSAEGATASVAASLQDSLAAAGALVDSLQGKLASGQQRMVELAEAAAKCHAAEAESRHAQGSAAEAAPQTQMDPKIEVSRLLREKRYEAAFEAALNLGDVGTVAWLCQQVEPSELLGGAEVPLSQGVLLSLIQQLGADLATDSITKLTWIKEAALVLDPSDVLLAPHMRPFLEDILARLRARLPAASGPEASLCRLVTHVVNSLMSSCM